MDFEHYLEVELPRLYLVSTVATLGGVTYAEYVTSYRVVYSVEGREWKNATVDGSQVMVKYIFYFYWFTHHYRPTI